VRVLVAHPLPEGSLDPLQGWEIAHGLHNGDDADGLICLLTDPITADVLAAHPRLRALANVAVGYDNIDVAAATAAGVAVCNTPGVLDETTADLAFALILAASRLMGDAADDLRAGRWPGWDVNQYLGQDVHGATLGLVGYGRIGQAVARRAKGFSVKVLHHTRHDTGEPGWVGDLDDLLPMVDVLSLHVPLSQATHHLLDRRRLGLLKPSAVVVNTARGPVVDEEALADALHAGRIFAAGLDVYEHEPRVHPRLLQAPRAVLLPHIGSGSRATRVRMGQMAAASVRQVLEGGRPANVVNPEVFGAD
jgi:glyoxylate reductase